MDYVKAFVTGGLICLVVQAVMDNTKLMPGRIMVGLVVTGGILGFLGIYEPFAQWAGAGASVPLLGFGNSLWKGVKEGMAENNTSEVYRYFNADSLEGYLAGYLTTAIVNGISFVLSYIIASIILRIAMFALGLVGELPGIRIVNQMAGLLLGLVKGIIVIWLALLVITVFCSTEVGASLLKQVERDYFLNFLYERDLFVKVFMSIFYS